MDWRYKHFYHTAIFTATPQSVLEAARLVAAESFVAIEDTTDGFIARGRSGGHRATATFHITAAPQGTQVAVELLVERASVWGYALFDVGGFYESRIDHWFLAIAQRLRPLPTPEASTSGEAGQTLISKTTTGVRTRRGCMAGCLVWLSAGACLGIASYPLDRALFPQSTASAPGPVSFLASLLSLLAGVAAFLYVTNPEASTSKFIRERLQRFQKKDGA